MNEEEESSEDNVPSYEHYPGHKINNPIPPESCCDGGRMTC